jgi:hypothetical protein
MISKKVKYGAIGGIIAGALALVVGVSGYSVFNASTSQSASDNTGVVAVDLTSGGGVGFTQSVSQMAPGDYIQREVVLKNTGTVGVSVADIQASVSACTVTGASTNCASTPLVAGDTVSPPMQVFGQTCSGTLTSTEIGSSGEYSFACSGSWATAFGVPTDVTGTAVTAPSGSLGYIAYTSGSPSTGSIGSPTAMTLPTTKNAQGISEVLAPGASVDLLLTSYLPTTADNAFQNNAATLNYTFTIVQRAGEAK